MSKAADFVKKGKVTLYKNTLKAIHDLLGVLDSEIIYPKNKDKSINESRLLAVVKSRGEAYNTAISLADEIELDRSTDTNLKNKFINGLKTTFDEMNKIIIRDIRSTEEMTINDEADAEIAEAFQTTNVTDDYIALLSKTKKEAYLLNKQILERISLLDDPDTINREKLDNIKATSIAELYADE